MPKSKFILHEEEADYTFGQAMADVDIAVKDFDESKHPRDSGGKFSESGGGDEEGERDPNTGLGVDTSEIADKYGLSAHEFEKVYSWTGGGYRQLRTDPSFGKALEKLPKVSGRVYRGTRVSEDGFKKLKVGATYPIEKFSSSSTQRVAAAPFMGAAAHSGEKQIAVLFEINDSGHKVPREIAKLAGTERENEVILMRGDRYKIEKIEEVEADDSGDDAIPAHYRVRMSHVHG